MQERKRYPGGRGRNRDSATSHYAAAPPTPLTARAQTFVTSSTWLKLCHVPREGKRERERGRKAASERSFCLSTLVVTPNQDDPDKDGTYSGTVKVDIKET